ncbi:four-carbon acid sugar kinase family protein [Actinomyces sp.]
MNMEVLMVSLDQLLSPYPQAPELSANAVRAEIRANSTTEPVFFVLDDDPTGTQSVADIPVLTTWGLEDCKWALMQEKPAIYVMTNSRSLPRSEVAIIIDEIVQNASEAARELNIPISFVSRSDSTLRCHFPLEAASIAKSIEKNGQDIDGIILIPAFPDAGRLTINGVHYCREGNSYIPVGESEFARDASFGFHSSELALWVEEKSRGEIPFDNVVTADLNCVRTKPEELFSRVMSICNGMVFAPDAACEEDLRAISLALIQAEAQGKHFVYHVGPPFMRARIGQDRHAPITSDEINTLIDSERAFVPGGLVVVGSHVAVTNAQLNHLTSNVPLHQIELDVSQVIDDSQREMYLNELAHEAIDCLSEKTVLISTSRKVHTASDPEASLAIARLVSASLVRLVQEIIAGTSPRFVIAKGGITSSDLASKALQMRHAMCIGPMLEGIISLWTACSGPALGIPYIVFPGNVGDETALTQVVQKLTASQK